MQIVWGKSGHTLAAKIGDGLAIWGGNSDDIVRGNADANVMHGGDGDDRVLGRKGADTITGDAGDDTLKGNGGADVLFGGAGDDKLVGGRGADTFAFTETGWYRDRIVDFGRGKDVIDLSAIDARSGSSADDAFTFIGRERFSGEAGELRYRVKDGNAILRGDTDGDGRADFAIHLKNVTHLDTDDLIL